MRLVIAGGTGYIGRALVRRAAAAGHNLQLIVRRRDDALSRYASQLNFDEAMASAQACANSDALINLAGCAHIRSGDTEFDYANRELPLNLARKVADGCIGRLIHVSSIGVYGNWRLEAISEGSSLAPDTPYGRSKLAGDLALEARFAARPDALTIVRPPMVYGPACPGNFARLHRLVMRGLPLPFGAARARRSFIFVENLADFLLECAVARNPAPLYVIGDGSNYSVSELIAEMASVRGGRSFNFAFPLAALRAFGGLAGMRRPMDSLTRPLLVDWTFAQESMHWSPPVSCVEAMNRSLSGGGL